MERMTLNGIYKLKYFDYDTFHIENVMCDNFFPNDWIDANVPEDVHTTLRRYGYLSGHYYDKDLDQERWIDEKDWVYFRSFVADERLYGHACTLCLEGVDTIARVWLNGTLLGTCQNMFREYTFPVGDALLFGQENRLVIQVLSPLGHTASTNKKGIYPEDDATRMLLRKSQMNWGWDFCGHCLTVGLWKSIYLKTCDEAALSDARLTTETLDAKEAKLHLSCTVQNGSAEDEVEIKLSAKGVPVCIHRLTADEARDFSFTLKEPRPWWPRPYGDPFLYDVCIRLLHGGATVDKKEFHFGLRIVELQQNYEDGGRSFLFRINGRRLFLRGANWVPLNCIYAEIRSEDYDPVFARVLDSNLSMLRIWGGGIYESEHFLDLCDKHGILVFQDMMLACGIFPQDEAFLRLVYEEVSEVVRRNYNRACIVMWSADNELDEAYRWYDKLEEFPTNRVNREAVQRAVLENDTSRPFLVSSPCSPFPEEPGAEDPNSDLQGDMHLYLTRFKKSDEYYYKKILDYKPRFMSEYGFSSLPSEPSYSRFNFRHGTLDLTRNPWLAQLDWLSSIGKTNDTEALIYYTQFTHAQALKYWIEYLRSLKWHCGGSLYWKFNDPIAPNREDMLFPSLMSSLDFYGLPKMAYYYARRAYEDRVLCFREQTDGSLIIYGCSETTDDLDGELELRLTTYEGKILWSLRQDACLAADSAVPLAIVPSAVLSAVPSYCCYLAAVFSDERCSRLKNIFHLTAIGEWDHVALPQAALHVDIHMVSSCEFELIIDTDVFVQDVVIEALDCDVYYSDNAFCMEKGERTVIRARIANNVPDWLYVRVRACNAKSICFGLAPKGDCNEV